jgi:hypothetical protein
LIEGLEGAVAGGGTLFFLKPALDDGLSKRSFLKPALDEGLSKGVFLKPALDNGLVGGSSYTLMAGAFFRLNLPAGTVGVGVTLI